jgi:hypothetical protein
MHLVCTSFENFYPYQIFGCYLVFKELLFLYNFFMHLMKKLNLKKDKELYSNCIILSRKKIKNFELFLQSNNVGNLEKV